MAVYLFQFKADFDKLHVSELSKRDLAKWILKFGPAIIAVLNENNVRDRETKTSIDKLISAAGN